MKTNQEPAPPVESLDSILGQVIGGVVFPMVGPRCKTKDLHDFPDELTADDEGRCLVCATYDEVDKAAQTIKSLIQTSNRDLALKQGVHHAAEMATLDQEIMSLKAEIKRLQTLTKEEL